MDPQHEALYNTITQKDLNIQSLLAEREFIIHERMSAVEELGTLRTSYRNLECAHFTLLQKYEQAKQEIQYGLNLGREMYNEYIFYKRGYEALLHHVQANSPPQPSENDVTSSPILRHFSLQLSENNVTSSPILRHFSPQPSRTDITSVAVVPLNKTHAAPPEVCCSYQLQQLRHQSSVEDVVASVTVHRLPSLHCPAILYYCPALGIAARLTPIMRQTPLLALTGNSQTQSLVAGKCPQRCDHYAKGLTEDDHRRLEDIARADMMAGNANKKCECDRKGNERSDYDVDDRDVESAGEEEQASVDVSVKKPRKKSRLRRVISWFAKLACCWKQQADD